MTSARFETTALAFLATYSVVMYAASVILGSAYVFTYLYAFNASWIFPAIPMTTLTMYSVIPISIGTFSFFTSLIMTPKNSGPKSRLRIQWPALALSLAVVGCVAALIFGGTGRGLSYSMLMTFGAAASGWCGVVLSEAFLKRDEHYRKLRIWPALTLLLFAPLVSASLAWVTASSDMDSLNSELACVRTESGYCAKRLVFMIDGERALIATLSNGHTSNLEVVETKGVTFNRPTCNVKDLVQRTGCSIFIEPN